VRLVLVDRVLHLAPGRAIETIKNVSATEDVFDDHFPGCPIFPGALIVGVFEQSAEVLIAMTHAFATVGRLECLSRASFRQFVRPGDQLRVRCERVGGDARRWPVSATAHVGNALVAAAALEFALVPCDATPDHAERAARLRALARELHETPFTLTGVGGPITKGASTGPLDPPALAGPGMNPGPSRPPGALLDCRFLPGLREAPGTR
jgi:3-hydroxyacyl-[acyl-carrier-protein] dehydratase